MRKRFSRVEYLGLLHGLEMRLFLAGIFSALIGIMLYDLPLKIRYFSFCIIFVLVGAGWLIEYLDLKKEYKEGYRGEL